MADTSVLVDGDELDVPSDPQFSELSDNKLDKFVEIPQGEIGKLTRLKLVKIDIQKSESTAGVSTWWYMLSVLGTTCCVLPYTMIKTHLKNVKARRMRDMKMPKSRCSTVVVLLMGVVSITIVSLLGYAIVCYICTGQYWMDPLKTYHRDYNQYPWRWSPPTSPNEIVEVLKTKIQISKFRNSELIAQSKNKTMEMNVELNDMIKLFTTTWSNNYDKEYHHY